MADKPTFMDIIAAGIEAAAGRPAVEPGVPFDCSCGCEQHLVRCGGCGADWAPPKGRDMRCPLCKAVTTVRSG